MQNMSYLTQTVNPRNMHILVVDDDPVILHYLKIMLGKKQYKATFLSSTDKNVVTSVGPDVILMDVWLGDEDGKEVCRSIKQHPETSAIPLMMMSSSREAAKKCIEAGADDFILKPFDIETLLRQITSLVPDAE